MWNPQHLFLLLLLPLPLIGDAAATIAVADGAPDGAPVSSSSSTTTQEDQPRRLAASDFAEFNELFSDASLALPDADVSRSGLTLRIRNLVCSQISIDNMTLEHTKNSESLLTLSAGVDPFFFTCKADYSYSFTFLRGSGRMEAKARNNRISSKVSLQSPTTFAQDPPSKTSVVECTSKLDIYDMTFRGGLVARIIDLFENLIDNVIEREVQKVVCEELSAVSTLLDNTLAQFKARLDPQLEPIPTDLANPLRDETALILPEQINLLNLKHTNKTIGYWFERVLQEADRSLGEIGKDPQGGPDDLGINIMLRNRLLDENGALAFDLSTLPSEVGFDPILFDGGDRLTESTITMTGVKIYGLDSLKSFNPLNMIGNYTVQNELLWEFLDVEVDLTVVMKPSTSEDSFLDNPGSAAITQDISVSFGLNKVDAVASFLLAIDQDKLGRIELASVLQSENALDCVLSSLFALNVSGLEVTLDSIDDPVLDGFVSAGIDRVITDAVEAGFVMYEDTFLRAAPRLFQDLLRDLLNTQVFGDLTKDKTCPTVEWATTSQPSLDWRDFFADPQQAKELGGTGLEPYGDLAHKAYQAAVDRFTEEGDDGTPGINDILVRPSTQMQSGVEGRFAFPSDIVSFVQDNITSERFSGVVDRFEFRISDGFIDNLDTVSTPLSFLKPTKNPSALSNSLYLGNSPVSDVFDVIGNIFNPDPLTMEARMFMNLEGKAPFRMSNEIKFSASVDSLAISADLDALVNAATIARFPLRHILNADCWISTLAADATAETVRRVIIETVGATLTSLKLKARCLSCTSLGARMLPELLDLVEENGVRDILGTRIPAFLVSLVESDWMHSLIDNRIIDASKFCPFQPEYDEDATKTERTMEMPRFSRKSIDTLLYTGVLGAWMGFLVFADNLRQQEVEASDPLFTERSFSIPEEGQLLDWNDLGNSTGLGSVLDEALGQLRAFLGGENDEGGLEINAFISGVLDEEGLFPFDPTGASFERDNLTISLDSVTVQGLDSFEVFDVLHPIGSQTLNNTLQLRELDIEMKVSAGYTESQDPPHQLLVRMSARDIRVDVAIFAAFDVDRLGDLPLGSLLSQDNILPCILSSAYALEIPQLVLSLNSFTEFSVRGLMQDTSDSIARAINVTLSKYEDTIKEAMPLLFEGAARELLTASIASYVSEATCPQPLETMTSSSAVDFRDFLLNPDEAKRRGGTGTAPYGNLTHRMYDLLYERFTELDDDGFPGINEMVVRRFTRNQSGVDGLLSFSDVFSFVEDEITNEIFSDVIDSFGFYITNARVRNLDTIAASPLTFLDPTDTGPVLSNELRLGDSPVRPFAFGARFLLDLEGRPPLDLSNEIDISASVDSLQISADVKALLDTTTLADFPLRHVLNVDCWMSALDTEDLVETLRGLAVESLDIALSSVTFNARCLSCTSKGADVLPELLALVDEQGPRDILRIRLPSLISSVVESNWFQTIVDRRLQEALHFCPFQEQYEESATRTATRSIGIPTLPEEPLDTVLYTGVVGLWVGFIVFSENLRNQDISPADPLADEESFEAPEEGELLDWEALGESTGLGSLADEALQEVRTYLGKKDEDGTLQINSLVEGFLEEDGSLSFELGGSPFELDELVVAIDSITLHGLNSFEEFDILNPIGSLTLDNSVRLKSLAAEMKLSMKYSTASDPPKQLSVRVAVADISADIALFAAFDVARLRQLPLGQILKIDNILPCILSAAFDIRVPRITLSLGSFNTLAVEGLLEDTSSSVARVIDSTLESYEETIVEAMPRLFEGALREVVSNSLSTFVDGANCRAPMNSTSSTYLDFRDLFLSRTQSLEYGGNGTSPYGDLFPKLLETAKNELLALDPVTGESAFNEMVVKPLTERRSGQIGKLLFEGDLFDRGLEIDVGGLKADVRVRVYDAYVENLDSFGHPLSVLETIMGEAHQLNNTASIGIGKPFRLGSRFTIELVGNGETIRNDIDVSLSMKSATIALTALIKVIESAFLEMPIEGAGQWKCWLAMLPPPKLDSRGIRLEGSEVSAALLNLGLSVAELALNVSCTNCTGPDMPVLTELLAQAQAIDDATEVANDVLKYVTDLLEGEFLQVMIDRLVADAKRECPFSPEFDKNFASPVYEPFDEPNRDESMALLVALTITAISIVLGLSVILLGIRVLVRLRHRRWLKVLSHEKLNLLSEDQHKRDEKVKRIDSTTKSLFQSDPIPAVVRFSVPLVILGNIAFFLSGHLSLGGSVTIMLSFAGEEYVADNFFDFSMASSAVEIWKAGGKELAMMILIFSGIWPYTKQLISLVLWFLPPGKCSVTTRENIYLWLDCLGKWSIIDIFVLVLTLAAFRVSVKSPDVDFLPDGFYQFDLLVIPKWGLYANMIAQIISQISSHFIIHFHRKVVHEATLITEENGQNQAAATVVWEMQNDKDGSISTGDVGSLGFSINEVQEERLCDHCFARPHRGESEKLVPRSYIAPLLVFVSTSLFALYVAGCAMPSYSLDILGIVGIMVESGQRFADANTDYSIFNTVKLLLEQAAFTGKVRDYLGLGTLSILLVATVLIIPLVQCTVLLFMWFRPMARRLRRRLMILIEILSAWQYAEVYLLSVIVASWQLGPVSEYMINAYCGGLAATFAQLVYYGVLKDEDAQCFRVNTSISTGFYILAAAAALLALLNTFVMKAVRQYNRDKDTTAIFEVPGKVVRVGDDDEDDELARIRDNIHPVPVLFTDTFRWLLRGESSAVQANYDSDDEDEEEDQQEQEGQRTFIMNDWDVPDTQVDEGEEAPLGEPESHI